MIVIIIVLAILIGIVLSILIYKRDRELRDLVISLLLLGVIIFLGVVGTVIHSLKLLYLIHNFALILSYGAYIIYLLRGRFYWYIYLLPLFTLLSYILLAWIGNRHISI